MAAAIFPRRWKIEDLVELADVPKLRENSFNRTHYQPVEQVAAWRGVS